MISVKEWKREMRTLDEAERIPNLIWPNLPIREALKIRNPEVVPVVLTEDQMKDTPRSIYDLRRAAECHKIARRNIQQYIKPGVKLLDICERVEANIVEIFGRNDLKAGVAFPTGTSVNAIIAHDTSNVADERTLKFDDLCKVDMGTHVNGMIIDSAFSVAFNPEYDKLLEASREAVWTGIRLAGPDAPIYDISKAIKEVIESYEVTIKGKTYPVKAVSDLGGHSIEPYNIHAGKLVLCAPYESREYKESRMEADEHFAIECFASTGSGKMFKSKSRPSNHYMLNKENDQPYRGKLKTIQTAYNWIRKNRSTLAFCPRWMEKDKVKGYGIALNELSRKTNPPIVTEYQVLEDQPGSLTAHYEHTIYISDHGKEILSHGDDY